ncbi:SIR2 family protein [Gallaecimonas pentaromativorans]|uniref:SIR2 family protein n=1 Tax=Gallaecimonas pentaromativorans TaxID=584787 RepID=UPI001E43338E|nr:SIR2 family protein [Gallaecimonas pentaromativorans]
MNFIFGSGASFGLFPTLWLPISDSDSPEKKETFETLVTKIEAQGKKSHEVLMFMYYYREIIEPVLKFDIGSIDLSHSCEGHDSANCSIQRNSIVIKNYKIFIESLILVLNQKSKFSKRCNIFTTNYDGCFPFAADALFQERSLDFIINDGSRGFIKRILSARNFNSYTCQTGIFGTNATDVPQINLINLHGSVYWKNLCENIQVQYNPEIDGNIIPERIIQKLDEFTEILKNESKSTTDILNFDVEIPQADIDVFWSAYKTLPIVNPTKWKFHETVFEEHYYQMLRMLSYELERPNSILISFGFSFADEHILNLIKRSLSNPRLQVYVCCFNKDEYQAMEQKFGYFKNVNLIALDNAVLDFTAFNKEIFNAECLKGEFYEH